MNIEITKYTETPIDDISIAAGMSYGKTEPSYKRLVHCFKNGHMSVFEFAYFTARIEGISRACSHQLVRHRHASYVQESQRYTKIEGDDWYVIPPALEDCTYYHDKMREAMEAYQATMVVYDAKPEDARFLLPEATRTNITMCMNARELFHFLDLRTDKAAQWEIRYLAEEIKDALYLVNDQWKRLIELWESSKKDAKPQD